MTTARKGFTLIELLAVIAIILILMTLLVPQLGRIADMGRRVRCMNNIRQIGIACITFASDHDGRLPGGSRASHQGTERWEKSWMGREVFPEMNPVLPDGTRGDPSWPNFSDGNEGYGTLVPYIGGEHMGGLYKCPSLPKGRLGEGYGSNGYFDYSILHGFCGAEISLIPLRAQLRYVTGDPSTWLNKATPLVVEEDPFYWANRTPNVEPSHGNGDRIGTWHNGTGNYLARDGSAQFCTPAAGEVLNPTANNWYSLSPNGNMVSLGNAPMRPYNSWKDK